MVLGSLVRLAETVRKTPAKPRLRKAAVELTEPALKRIKDLLENRHKVCVSVCVCERGRVVVVVSCACRVGNGTRWGVPCRALHSISYANVMVPCRGCCNEDAMITTAAAAAATHDDGGGGGGGDRVFR